MDLISELKREHFRITDSLTKVLNLGVNSEEGKNMIDTTRRYLLTHLEKEDIKLYPVLWKVAEYNNDLKQTLYLYAGDVEKISKMSLEFFGKYASGGDILKFEKDYQNLFVTLNKRIIKEETLKYKMYNEIMS